MRKGFILFAGIAAIALSACGSSRKAASSTGTATTPPVVASPRPSNGVYAPGEAELDAIRKTNPEVAMATLSEGYTLYTGACTKCHGAKSIYSRSAGSWPGIIADMAPRARLSEVQKDAVLKYVLAIKAAQRK